MPEVVHFQRLKSRQDRTCVQARFCEFLSVDFEVPHTTLPPSSQSSTPPTHKRNHGGRKEQAIVKGQEGPEEEDGSIRAQGLVLAQGALHLQHSRVRFARMKRGIAGMDKY